MRKFVAAGVVLLAMFSIALAEEVRVIITKIDGDKVTYFENKGMGEKGPEQTATGFEKAQILKGKGGKGGKVTAVGEALAGDERAAAIKIAEGKTLNGLATIEDKKISKLIVVTGKGGKKKKDAE